MCLCLAAGGSVEKLKNEKVSAVEYTLRPGETVTLDAPHPVATVYFEGGTLEFTPAGGGSPRSKTVKRGDVTFGGSFPGTLKNTGASDAHFVTVNFLTKGNGEVWAGAGLAPNYKLLFENPFTRTYEIRIPAGTKEPQHTHQARVVVCLSGAILKHKMPDGKEETATLQTGEIAWRPAATHIGQNLGKTDLWVIAIEPK